MYLCVCANIYKYIPPSSYLRSSYPLVLKAWKMSRCGALHGARRPVDVLLPLAAILRCGSAQGPRTSKEPSKDVALVTTLW